jgi:hypothetical protein
MLAMQNTKADRDAGKCMQDGVRKKKSDKCIGIKSNIEDDKRKKS